MPIFIHYFPFTQPCSCPPFLAPLDCPLVGVKIRKILQMGREKLRLSDLLKINSVAKPGMSIFLKYIVSDVASEIVDI